MQITISQAKRQLLKMVEKAAAGERVVITRWGKPYVDLVSHQTAQPRLPGRSKDKISFAADSHSTPECLITDFDGGQKAS